MFFDYEKLKILAEENSEKYQAADPFPHIYFDNFLSESKAMSLYSAFPSPDQIKWWKYDNFLERKLAINESSEMPEMFDQMLMELNSSKFIRFLEKLTGIKNLIPDPHHRGGGLHQIVKGGKLHIHKDFSVHPDLKLKRVLNVLIYLNPDWKEEYGGHLEFWDKDMQECRAKILPVLGRMACFTLSTTSWHGHPDPLNCPDGWTRKSIAAYYYINQPEAEVHSTVYRKRPSDQFTPEEEMLMEKRSKGRLEDKTT
jgi:Rps23 Pro-64 3,4-dihydroxylase Tpa1-like proline 4-hydroxylase